VCVCVCVCESLCRFGEQRWRRCMSPSRCRRSTRPRTRVQPRGEFSEHVECSDLVVT
jgi:hypothetical protein